MKKPHAMTYEELNALLHNRIMDIDYDDDDLVATREETCALLSWAQHYHRASQPRSAEEQRAYDIIRSAAALLEKPDGK